MREKIYEITFNRYTNALRNTVSDGNPDIAKIKYIDLPDDVPFLVRESTLPYYSRYGGGISVAKCVGELDTTILESDVQK